MDILFDRVVLINEYLSDYVLITMLLGSGLYFTIKTRFVQIRSFFEGWKNAFGKFPGRKKGHGNFSPFQALTAAIAAQVGTGNIVGVSGAILLGGPGTIFWMWLVAFLGMGTIYAEAVLAQKTRIIDGDGTPHGGPAYYIRHAFPNLFGRILAGFFAAGTVISLGFSGSMVQANSIAETCYKAFGIPVWCIGFAVAATAGVIFFGGVNRLAKVTKKLVPFMALIYLTGGIAVLFSRLEYLPDTFMCIFKYAFTPEAIIGGGFGSALKTAISHGVKRGLFSNEAGMGSTPHAHAIAEVPSPHIQGTVAMIGVFIDTAIILTMTALIVISTLYTGDGLLVNASAENYRALLISAGLSQTNLVQYAISSATNSTFGDAFVAVCLFFFALSTIISWNYFGRINCHYLLGKKSIFLYSILAMFFIFIGSQVKSDLVWELQSMFNQLIVLPNIIALFALSGVVAAAAGARKR